MSDFICRMCGTCCYGEGSAFLYPDDVKRIATELNLSIQSFVDNYTKYILFEIIEGSGSYLYIPYLTLNKKNDGCIFVDDKVCTIHKFKPFHCSHTPFVSEFFSDEEWRKQIKQSCLGLKEMKEEDFKKYEPMGEESEQKEKEYYYLLRENSFNLESILDIKLSAPEIIANNE